MMYNKMKKNKTGFTLIEIIVVVFIIGIIISFVVVSFSAPRQKSRDVKRISDITQLQTALNTYRQFEGSYPESLTAGEPLVGPNTGTIFLRSVPENPIYPDEDCIPNNYVYTYKPAKNSYIIEFCLEGSLDNYSSGIKCATPDGILNHICDACNGDTKITYEGRDYSIVAIGDQCWFRENLRHDNGCLSVDWVDYDYDGWCGYYNDDEETYGDYGLLYHWEAVMAGDTEEGDQGICPDGWHVPTDDEWTVLSDYLGGSAIAGGKMKSTSTEPDSHPRWDSPNEGASNESGFSALPGGYRSETGNFLGIGLYTRFWSSSCSSWGAFIYCSDRNLSSDSAELSKGSWYKGLMIASVRCLKD
jgi:uncharacterized protein (TIGR02145 family)/prepilin-type N-terminal cleavage/methylation domain-containing protein